MSKKNYSKKIISLAMATIMAGSLASCTIKEESYAGINNDFTTNDEIETSLTTWPETTTEVKTTKEETTTELFSTTKPLTTQEMITSLTEIRTEVEELTTKKLASNQIISTTDTDFKLSDDLNRRITNSINNFNKSNVSFQVYDIETGNTFNYNLGQTYNGASIVKTSIVLYLLKLAEQGKVNLNKKIAYPGNVVGGSGYLNGYYNGYQAETGKELTLFEYMFHCQYYSDNNAYRVVWKQLLNSGYYDEYQAYMNSIGATSLCPSTDSMWVRAAKAPAGVNVMKEVYKFKQSSTGKFKATQKFVDGHQLSTIAGKDVLTYGEILYFIMAKGEYDFIETQTGNLSITKTGFVSGSGNLSSRHLTSISYGDRTFIVCVLSKWGPEDARTAVMNQLVKELTELISEYDKHLAYSAPKEGPTLSLNLF